MDAGPPREAKEDAKQYVAEKQLPQLFESITAGLLHHRPGDPLLFVQECLANVKDQPENVRWNSFIEYTPSERAMSGKKRPGMESAQGSSTPSSFKKDPSLEPSKSDIENSLNKGYTQYTKTPDAQT